MEDFLDSLWLNILVLVHYIKTFLDLIFAPLNSLGPAFAIFTIAFITVIITKILTKAFITKRYKELKKNFEYWHNVRQEAMKCEDREKAKSLAKNIDQAELNRAYYDFFLEGLYQFFLFFWAGLLSEKSVQSTSLMKSQNLMESRSSCD